jgi:hypothetical protein
LGDEAAKLGLAAGTEAHDRRRQAMKATLAGGGRRFLEQPCLADAGIAADIDDPAGPFLAGYVELGVDLPHFRFPADEAGGAHVPADLLASRKPEDGEFLGKALKPVAADGFRRIPVSCRRRQIVRQQDLAALGQIAQPGREIDR